MESHVNIILFVIITLQTFIHRDIR